MCKGLIGKKVGMTSLFSSDGRMTPVTVIELGPCVITQVKTQEVDGYNALQLAFGQKKIKNVNKPLKGHLDKSGIESARVLKEVPAEDPTAYSAGQVVNLEIFNVGERVAVTGKSKGRGFSGVIKRHGFSGGRKTHGSKCHRIPGSIGCSAWPSRVFKGKKLPGRYGNDKITVKNLEIVDIRPDENLVLVKGAVPGANSGFVVVRKSGAVK